MFSLLKINVMLNTFGKTSALAQSTHSY